MCELFFYVVRLYRNATQGLTLSLDVSNYGHCLKPMELQGFHRQQCYAVTMKLKLFWGHELQYLGALGSTNVALVLMCLWTGKYIISAGGGGCFGEQLKKWRAAQMCVVGVI